MKRYAIILEETAQADIRQSYEWGRLKWGKQAVQEWVGQLHSAIKGQLTIVPKGFPLAPEHDEFAVEIRQMVVGRYRVLFTIKNGKVHVLHVRGAFVAEATGAYSASTHLSTGSGSLYFAVLTL